MFPLYPWRIQGSLSHTAKVPEGVMEEGGRQGPGQGSAKHVGMDGEAGITGYAEEYLDSSNKLFCVKRLTL